MAPINKLNKLRKETIKQGLLAKGPKYNDRKHTAPKALAWVAAVRKSREYADLWLRPAKGGELQRLQELEEGEIVEGEGVNDAQVSPQQHQYQRQQQEQQQSQQQPSQQQNQEMLQQMDELREHIVYSVTRYEDLQHRCHELEPEKQQLQQRVQQYVEAFQQVESTLSLSKTAFAAVREELDTLTKEKQDLLRQLESRKVSTNWVGNNGLSQC